MSFFKPKARETYYPPQPSEFGPHDIKCSSPMCAHRNRPQGLSGLYTCTRGLADRRLPTCDGQYIVTQMQADAINLHRRRDQFGQLTAEQQVYAEQYARHPKLYPISQPVPMEVQPRPRIKRPAQAPLEMPAPRARPEPPLPRHILLAVSSTGASAAESTFDRLSDLFVDFQRLNSAPSTQSYLGRSQYQATPSATPALTPCSNYSTLSSSSARYAGSVDSTAADHGHSSLRRHRPRQQGQDSSASSKERLERRRFAGYCEEKFSDDWK
ncbi:hypothetical protein HGRIS_003368 [Hohenbuehelia grisea]|uniref:Uncharacterized protein n=1 Tax=Hohenbuehelia grisea TaxID=104357 RepID=A0ABR3JG87_9AGAR